MIDLLKSLIDWDALPRQQVAPGEVIIAGGESTSILFCLERGKATGPLGTDHDAGDILSLCEGLVLDRYATRIDAVDACDLVVLEQTMLETALRNGGRLVLPLTRSIAADVTQRQLAG
ncbi:MAG: hypothetical protein ACPH8C_05460 [Candidatus Puniceispirillaceae bacterium]